MSKWYIDKIKAVAPELLDGDKYDILDWIDNIQSSLSGKTLLEHLAAITETTFEPCSKKSDRPKFQCLNLKGGQPAEWSEFRSVTSHGERLTLNIGEFPSAVVESSLSQILQNPTDVPQKYYLSSKACQGILRRAAKRGKELPEVLRIALESQACV